MEDKFLVGSWVSLSFCAISVVVLSALLAAEQYFEMIILIFMIGLGFRLHFAVAAMHTKIVYLKENYSIKLKAFEKVYNCLYKNYYFSSVRGNENYKTQLDLLTEELEKFLAKFELTARFDVCHSENFIQKLNSEKRKVMTFLSSFSKYIYQKFIERTTEITSFKRYLQLGSSRERINQLESEFNTFFKILDQMKIELQRLNSRKVETTQQRKILAFNDQLDLLESNLLGIIDVIRTTRCNMPSEKEDEANFINNINIELRNLNMKLARGACLSHINIEEHQLKKTKGDEQDFELELATPETSDNLFNCILESKETLANHQQVKKIEYTSSMDLFDIIKGEKAMIPLKENLMNELDDYLSTASHYEKPIDCIDTPIIQLDKSIINDAEPFQYKELLLSDVLGADFHENESEVLSFD